MRQCSNGSQGLRDLLTRNMLSWVGVTAPEQDNPSDRRLDDGASYIEEPPETPAPLFAVRAFQQAIFGTPHPMQQDAQSVRPQQSQPQHKRSVTKPRPAGTDGGENTHVPDENHFSRTDAMLSPAKGILLTPGTGATRRKTVSFGKPAAAAQERLKELSTSQAEPGQSTNQIPDNSLSVPAGEDQPRHSTLTKTLIQLSKQRSDRNLQATSLESQESEARNPQSNLVVEKNLAYEKAIDPTADLTVDLCQPRSKSGQHWKAEYDRYYKKSNHEMKQIIKYGQNVKSYAAKKDSEATGLGEKLKIELSKVARMEARISKLAKQLRVAQQQGPDGESDQTRLVSELAQQTALAIRYKQKADQYRRAISKQPSNGDPHEIEDQDKMMQEIDIGDPFELATLRAQLESLRETAKVAEDRAAHFEAENRMLKQSLARVKEEMMSYDKRRQTREERLKKREQEHKAAKETCEAQLAQLKMDHQKLLQASHSNFSAKAPPIEIETRTQHPVEITAQPVTSKRIDYPNHQTNLTGINNPIIPSTTSRKHRPQKSTIDIWTLSSPRDQPGNPPPPQEPTPLGPSSVKHDIHKALQEINHNLRLTHSPVLDHPNAPQQKQSPSQTNPSPIPPTHPSQPHPPPPSHTHGEEQYPHITTTTTSSSPPPLHHPRPSLPRSSSLLSKPASRTSTMGSTLPAERAAAARARLAKRSAEKKNKKRSMLGDGR